MAGPVIHSDFKTAPGSKKGHFDFMKTESAEYGRNFTTLAALGAGRLGYFREFAREEAIRRFPDAADIKKAEKLWALFAADGTLLLLTENRTSIFFKAMEDELTTVTLH